MLQLTHGWTMIAGAVVMLKTGGAGTRTGFGAISAIAFLISPTLTVGGGGGGGGSTVSETTCLGTGGI